MGSVNGRILKALNLRPCSHGITKAVTLVTHIAFGPGSVCFEMRFDAFGDPLVGTTVEVDINAPLYQRNNTSKGKRLWGFLEMVDDSKAARGLCVLWEHLEPMRRRANSPDLVLRPSG